MGRWSRVRSMVVCTATLGSLAGALAAPAAHAAAPAGAGGDLLTGHVRDASGHGWALRARVSLSGTDAATYTDPATGAFALDVPAGTAGDLTVESVYPGYPTDTRPVTVESGGTDVEVGLGVDTSTCSAPGYRFDGLTEDFDSETLPEGWRIDDNAGTGIVWTFNDPGGRSNQTGGHGGFAIIDKDAAPPQPSDTSLRSPSVDLSEVDAPELQFDTDYRDIGKEQADVDVSTDGGQTWAKVWSKTNSYRGPVTEVVPLPQAAHQSDVRVRFHYYPSGAYWWAVDDVMLGRRGCVAVDGGLVVGTALDANTGLAIRGARARLDGERLDSDPVDAAAEDSGRYWGFAAAGDHELTVDMARYQTVTRSVSIRPDEVVDADSTLDAGRLETSESSLDQTVPWGRTSTSRITLTNTGTAPLTVRTHERDHGFGRLDADGGNEPPRRRNPAWHDPAPLPPDRAWTTLPPLPTAISENVAGSQDGRLYSFGGSPLDGVPTTNGWRLDDGADHWARTAPMPSPRLGASGGFVDGRMIMVGGWLDKRKHLASGVLRYDPGTDTWSVGAAAPEQLAGSGSAILDGVVYTVGGCRTSCGSTTVLAYDVAADEFHRVADYPERTSWTACGAVDGRIVCAGGNDNDDSYGAASTWIYDPASNSWSAGARFPAESWGSSSWSSGGRLIVAGGMYAGFPVRDTWRYDPSANKWGQLPYLKELNYRGGSACGVRLGGSIGGYSGARNVNRLPGYTDCTESETDVDWLSTDTGTDTDAVTLAPGASITMQIGIDPVATDQPGDLAAELGLSTDTPYAVSALPTRLRVPAPKDWGLLRGTVSATQCAGDTAPMLGATVQIDGDTQGWTLRTGPDGSYARWIDRHERTLQVVVGQTGYEIETRSLRAPKDPTDVATQDFDLQRLGC